MLVEVVHCTFHGSTTQSVGGAVAMMFTGVVNVQGFTLHIADSTFTDLVACKKEYSQHTMSHDIDL